MAARDDFPGFCVVTQSCDLVRCRCADFITLAVIRKVGDVFSAEDVSGKRATSTSEVLRRLINHSEDKRGYFYLHKEESLGIDVGEGAVVDLRVMFSLRTTLHYDQLKAARKMSVDDAYANKLGWMAGHLFSRVPTREWQELELGETADQVLARLLGAIKTRGGPKLPHEKPID
jgi:hypothetical protein